MTNSHGLIVTHLSFVELERRISGTYRRLETIVTAARESGAELTIYCMATREEIDGSLERTAERVREELLRCWGVSARVIVGERQQLSTRIPWIFHQAAGITSYERRPATRMLLPVDVDRTLARLLDERPAFIIAHRLPIMDQLARLQRPLPPTFFDLDDIEHLVLLRGLRRMGSVRERLFNALALPALMHAERRAMRRATRTFVCSTDDATRIGRRHGVESVEVLPNVVTLPDLAPPGAGQVMLMVGLFSYEPNADGADWFIDDVLPAIRTRLPQAELWLAGKSPETIRAFARKPEGVRFLGYVEDLERLYHQARLVVCPVRFGSGTRIKLVEAAAYGKALVSTTIGAEGLGMTSGSEVLLADTADAFAEACTSVLQRDDLCRRLESAARRLAERRFDRAVVVRRLAEAFRACLPPGEAPPDYAPPPARERRARPNGSR